MNNSNEINDIYISYNWEMKQIVSLFYQRLRNELNLKVFKEEKSFRTNNSSLTQACKNTILNSKIFICCMNDKYNASKNCSFEFDLAKKLKKFMIIILLEKMKIEKNETTICVVNSFKNNADKWLNNDFETIKSFILNNIDVT